MYYQHLLLEAHSQELDGLRRPDLSFFPKAKLNKVQKNSQKVQVLFLEKEQLNAIQLYIY